ncbi:MAG: endonuclease/exonuclease/phosphatase family protein [Chitinispirillaceae bacterium]
MIHGISTLLRHIRRFFSRSEWAVKLLSLSRSRKHASTPGLILIQIDGLSRTQFEKALSEKRMPFVQSLMEKQDYLLLSHYSGVPSTTPAVQAELLYGCKLAVPAFAFRDHHRKDSGTMLMPHFAERIEERLEARQEGLLRDGSSYGNIYRGGAAESNFCVTTDGFGQHFRESNPFRLLIVILLYSAMWARVGALLVVELVLAVIDFAKGFYKRKNFFKELAFIPSRVGICIMLRELVTAGVVIDAARGLPIIHANFSGYDEQAHRRGPESGFAHWTLAGIDDAVYRIWRAAKRSAYRDYDVWVFSDHGQEHSIPYELFAGKSIEKSVSQALDQVSKEKITLWGSIETVQHQRARLIGMRLFGILFNRSREPQPSREFDIAAKGPVGHLYLRRQLSARDGSLVARHLVEQGKVPIVLRKYGQGKVIADTAQGTFSLPREAAAVLGGDHPFLQEVADDLTALVHHPDSGDIVLSGWQPDSQPVTFPVENGAHAGPGREETHGFALLPHDAPFVLRNHKYLRPIDLRNAILRFQNKRTPLLSEQSFATAGRDRTLRIMTYNVHSCLGMDGRLSPERIARVIAAYDPDIIALQELDVGRLRSGGVDQAHQIARALDMEFHFHPSFIIEEEQYGNALLSRFPMKVIKKGSLPQTPGAEKRGALWVRISYSDRQLDIVNTHLGLRAGERLHQIQHLLGPEWIGGRNENSPPIILCGDFNTVSRSRVYNEITMVFADSKRAVKKRFFSRTLLGLVRIDYVFVSPEIHVSDVRVPRNHLIRSASDHFPLIVDMLPEHFSHQKAIGAKSTDKISRKIRRRNDRLIQLFTGREINQSHKESARM